MTKTVTVFFSRKIIYHTCFWIAHTAFLLLLLMYTRRSLPLALEVVGGTEPILIITSYIHFYLMEKFLYKRKLFRYFIFSAIAMGICSVIHHQIPFNSDSSFLINTLGFLSAIFVISSIKLIKKGIEEHLKLQEMTQKQVETELNFLKTQINPHFLFNTLNSLYSLSLKNSPRTPEMILKLSELMKYILTKATLDKVDLEHEIDFLHNYIAIHELRFSDKSDILFNVDGDLSGLLISPLIFFPFIENSFKHGIGSSSKGSYIHIDLKTVNNRLYLSVENSIPKKLAEGDKTSLGTGLTNVRKSLEFVYRSKYNLEISDKNDIYLVKLDMEL